MISVATDRSWSGIANIPRPSPASGAGAPTSVAPWSFQNTWCTTSGSGTWCRSVYGPVQNEAVPSGSFRQTSNVGSVVVGQDDRAVRTRSITVISPDIVLVITKLPVRPFWSISYSQRNAGVGG